MSKPDEKTGYCAETKTFRSLRSTVPLPPETAHISVASYALSLQSNSPYPHTTAAVIDSSTGKKISYSQFHRYVKALAFSLRNEIGLTRNDVAFVLSSNSIRVPILYFSLLSIGVAVSPANPIGTQPEISRQLDISKSTVVFATSATAGKIKELGFRTVLIDSEQFESMMLRNLTISDSEQLLRSTSEVNQNDVAAILFSSGTTGRVKGVELTHRNFISIISNFYHQRENRLLPAVTLYTVPFFHVFGFHYCFKSVALTEAVVVVPGRFDLVKMLTAVEDHKVTHLAVVPPIVVAMVKSKAVKEFDLRSLEAVGSGAAPLGRGVIKAFVEKFNGVMIFQGYGMTETSGAMFRVADLDESLRRGSVGKLQPNFEAKIVDPETGTSLPPGDQGELWIRGPAVMKGYVNDPKANSEALVPGGWLRTGDICYIDDEGFLFVVDRLKELIKYKGYQVAPAELEQLLQSHPDIVDAAVIPYPDEEAGQVPLAFVVRRPQSKLEEGQVIEFVAEQVAPYKKVRRVSFISSIPKSAAGKILRKELVKISLPSSKL